MKWNGDAALELIRKDAASFVLRALITVRRHAVDLLSIAGTGRVAGVQHGPVERSKPGEPPRKQAGQLHDSVTYEMDEATLTGRVGTNVKHGKWLELGTKRGILPRPWLRRALAEMQTRVSELLAMIKEKK